MTRYTKKRVLITGAGGGLGRSLALQFAGDGWKVAIAEIDRERARETANLVNKAGGEGLDIFCDVTKYNELETMAALLESKWGGIDILINNAALVQGGYFEKFDLPKWDDIINLNLKAYINSCKIFIPIMEENGGGHIVNIASCAGIASFPEMSSYNVTKAGVICLSETLRVELASKRIRVTVVAPTFFKTNFLETFYYTDDRQREMIERILSKSRSSSDDVARYVIKSIKKNRLYSFPQWDGRMVWRLKRLLPESYPKGVLFSYRHERLMKLFLGM